MRTRVSVLCGGGMVVGAEGLTRGAVFNQANYLAKTRRVVLQE